MSWLQWVPKRFLPILQNQPPELLSGISEVRLRLDRPFSVTVRGKNVLFDPDGLPCGTSRAVRAGRRELTECLSMLTGGSYYAYEEQMGMGFLTLPDGCRAGIAGEMISLPGGGRTFREVTSVNLRISRFFPRFAEPLTDRLEQDGLTGALIISPPAGGKTTFLKSAAWLLSTGLRPHRVGIADERGELSVRDGISDRVAGLPKAAAIELLTRTLSPEVIVCDELGAGEESAILGAQNTGVALIASVHAADPAEALRRPCVACLVEAGVFPLFVTLGKDFRVTIERAKRSEKAVCGRASP